MANRVKMDGTIYLMRHGRTALDVEHRSDGWLDMPLSSPEGEISVIPAQQKLKAIPLREIYTPTLKRTVETAEIVGSGNIGKPKITKTDKAKTWNLGVLAGMRKRYGRPEVQKLIEDPSKAPMGGESYNAFKKRFMPWFKHLLGEAIETGDTCLVICSGSNLRCIGKFLFDDEDSIDLDEGGLVVLRHVDGDWHSEVLCGDTEDKDMLDAVNKALARYS